MDQPVNRIPEFRFGPFELDPRTGELRKFGIRLRVPEQSYRVLLALLENYGNLVTREDLRQRLWDGNTFVDFEHGLNLAVTRLRQALGDSAENPCYIETIPRRGYRFIASLRSEIRPDIPPATEVEVDSPCAESLNARDRVPDNASGSDSQKSFTTVSERAALRIKVHLKAWHKIAFLLAILLLVAGAIRWSVVHHSDGRPGLQSIAVLPLTNLASKPNEDYLAEGITEELITELGRIESLRVISRTSVMRYKNTSVPLPEISRALNVDAIVEGTFRRAGDRVRVTVQLIGIAPEHQMWSDAYDGDTQDILELQRQVARDIALNVRTKLAGSRQKPTRRTRHIDLETYEEYLRGRHFLANRDADGITKAATYFQEATRRDPQYAEAYAGLAVAYGLLATYDLRPPAESFPLSIASANSALALDSSLAEAYTARARCVFLGTELACRRPRFPASYRVGREFFHRSSVVWRALHQYGKSEACSLRAKARTRA